MSIDRRYTSGGFLPLRDALDRLFEGSVISPQTLGQGGFPPADLYSTADEVVVEMAVPGVNPDDINVSVTGDTVSISGEIRQRSPQEQGRQPFFQEIWRGRFQRVLTLPTQVEAGKARAEFENGVLTLTLPKSEATKPRKIQVRTQSSSGQQSGGAGSGAEHVPVSSDSPPSG